MNDGRPASLDGSLLARKGDATPAIAHNSPLTEELGEPRPDPIQMSFGASHTGSVPSATEDGSGARGRTLSVMLLVLVAAAIMYTASQVLPTAATVTSLSQSDAKSTDETGGKAEGSLKSDPAPSKAREVTEKTATPEKPIDATSGPAAPADTIIAAKNAPVAVVVPQATVAKLPKSPPSVRSGRYLLQLASLPSDCEARRELARLQDRLRPVLGKRKIAVVRAVPKGRSPVYSLRASAYRTQKLARTACNCSYRFSYFLKKPAKCSGWARHKGFPSIIDYRNKLQG